MAPSAGDIGNGNGRARFLKTVRMSLALNPHPLPRPFSKRNVRVGRLRISFGEMLGDNNAEFFSPIRAGTSKFHRKKLGKGNEFYSRRKE